MLHEIGFSGIQPSIRLPAIGATSAVQERTNYKYKYEDTLELTNDLKQTAEQCKNLAERLKRKGEVAVSKPPPLVMAEKPKAETYCCKDVQEKLKTANGEVIRLRHVLKDVTEINKRWQKYNRQQQDYVQRLHGNIRTFQKEKDDVEMERKLLKDKLLEINPSSSEKRKQIPLSYRHSDSSLMENTSASAALQQSYEKVVKENYQLEKELEASNERMAALQREANKAKEAYKEELELLEMQIRTNKEDWEAERIEKETEKTKVNVLSAEIERLKAKCRGYCEKLASIERTCRCSNFFDDNCNLFESPDWRTLRRHQSASPTSYSNIISADGPHAEVLSRGPSEVPEEAGKRSCRQNGRSTTENAIETDCDEPIYHSSMFNDVKDIPSNGSFEIINGACNREGKDVVICPGCQRSFSSKEHLNFLDHFEECQKNL